MLVELQLFKYVLHEKLRQGALLAETTSRTNYMESCTVAKNELDIRPKPV